MRSKLTDLLIRDDGPVFSEVGPVEGYSGGPGWTNLPTVGPEVRARRSGLHIIAFGAAYSFPATAGVMYFVGVAINGTDPPADGNNRLVLPMQLGATGQVLPLARQTRLALNRGDLLRLRYYSVSGAPSFGGRWLSITPIAA